MCDPIVGIKSDFKCLSTVFTETLAALFLYSKKGLSASHIATVSDVQLFKGTQVLCAKEISSSRQLSIGFTFHLFGEFILT